ncbi:MAG TPA: 16S rRNA (adenine(1518)-N(6)/adenine(1519)-N(6))-dimethyltransferase RsmA [Alphaproteobacteria bacterium]|nr:16S rRNA (adenine(1518)-N(6)/adenine(1519)-N(6))-dimethyltransferase RsmA [Alphaproteobacteria bacterium]
MPRPLADLPPLREVIARHGLLAKKSLGQHFLLDLNLTRRIAAAAGNLSGVMAIEIGPGPGGLTRALLETEADKVVVIEKDRRCIGALEELAASAEGRLKIVEGDALQIDVAALAKGPRAIVANLPYNIGTELLLKWLKDIDRFRSLTLMFQAEVAARIAARPGIKAYGRLSVIAQFCCHVEQVLEVPARAFTPPPKVDSAVVHLTPRRERPKDLRWEAIEKVTAAGFGQRRKMLRSSLKPLGGETLLRHAGIDPALRAENLSVGDFEKLARRIAAGD